MTENSTTERAAAPDPALTELDVLDGAGGWVPWMSYTMERID
jgi:hypothetical protein